MNWVPYFRKYLKTKLPLYVGLVGHDLAAHVGEDYIYIDRGYWNRSQMYRVIRGGIHLTRLLDRPADRLRHTEMRPWQSGAFVVVIPPSKYQMAIFPDAASWVDELDLQTEREIRIKWDKQLPFAEYLKGAQCVVSYGSVAAVKAAMWGYPVLSGPHCPATPINCESVDSPVLKDREPWLRSLSYAQWSQEEIVSLNLTEYDYSRSYHLQ